MLLAIDAGNTHVVVGLHDGSEWKATWRFTTATLGTEDDLMAKLSALWQKISPTPLAVRKALFASVVPALNPTLRLLGTKWLQVEPIFLSSDNVPNLKVKYEPPSAVGADRLANALAARELFGAPALIVDFGTATTIDAVDEEGAYSGGSIFPGLEISQESLFQRAAKLPKVEISPPRSAIGKTTTESLQSGLVYGYAGAVDTLVRKMRAELATSSFTDARVRVLATGGLAPLIAPFCEEVDDVVPLLTLEGLRIAGESL
ncbi:MAG: type III pantothenate kinase [Fimbriimonadales bacterium]|nr:type III pantothenate kinase [Fimbriimonadales bacterium]